MKKIKQNLRLLVQVVVTALTNGYVIGFVKGKIYTGKMKELCVPGLNCFSCPGALGACPIGSLQAVIGHRNYHMSFYVVGFLMLVGSLCGRFVCGWLCPFGLVQDLMYRIGGKKLKKRKNLWGHKYLVYVKYVILAVLVILLPMLAVNSAGAGTPWFCKLVCPSGTLMGGIPLTLLNENIRSSVGGLFYYKLGLLIGLLVLSVWIFRPFCKYLCPLGAIYGWFNPIALNRYYVNSKKCVQCKVCSDICPMGVEPVLHPNSAECIRCGKCKNACPTGAITSILKKANDTKEEKEAKE